MQAARELFAARSYAQGTAADLAREAGVALRPPTPAPGGRSEIPNDSGGPPRTPARLRPSVDHRGIDGAQAARFLQVLTTLIEQPWVIIT
jgi:2-oxoacid dehydrogenases acyltransferase (catalytic domain)/Bacterial regulatory proteins, tetR family